MGLSKASLVARLELGIPAERGRELLRRVRWHLTRHERYMWPKPERERVLNEALRTVDSCMLRIPGVSRGR